MYFIIFYHILGESAIIASVFQNGGYFLIYVYPRISQLKLQDVLLSLQSSSPTDEADEARDKVSRGHHWAPRENGILFSQTKKVVSFFRKLSLPTDSSKTFEENIMINCP